MVLLPEPDGPTKAIVCPRFAVNCRFFIIGWKKRCGYANFTFSKEILPSISCKFESLVLLQWNEAGGGLMTRNLSQYSHVKFRAHLEKDVTFPLLGDFYCLLYKTV